MKPRFLLPAGGNLRALFCLALCLGCLLCGCQPPTGAIQTPYAEQPTQALESEQIVSTPDVGNSEQHAPNHVGNTKQRVLKQGVLKLPPPYGETLVTYEVIDGLAIFQGDIVLGTVNETVQLPTSDEPLISAGKGTLEQQLMMRIPSDFLWPNGEIPYSIAPDVPLRMREYIQAAIEHWEEKTSIRFRAATTDDTDAVMFVNNRPNDYACSAHVGRIVDERPQYIYLNGGFRSLVIGGENWGSDSYATSIAFGDVDGDGRDEIGYTRFAGENLRVEVVDDANAATPYQSLLQIGTGWGSDSYATSIAFGKLDNDRGDEFGISRISGTGSRLLLYEDGTDRPARSLVTIRVLNELDPDVVIGQSDGLSEADIQAVEQVYGP